MEKIIGNFRIFIEETYEDLGKKAAEVIAEQINGAKETVIGFATGGTPVSTYNELIKLNKDEKVDFSGVTAFNLDEYYPIKKTNDQSYDYFMKENLFNHVNINKGKLHIPNGEAKDPEEECDNYEKQIAEIGGINLQLLGIGLNGHIGFNEPDDKFSSKTNYVGLTKSTIEANARYFEKEEDVPKKAISMGIKTIMMAEKILLIASGENKAEIIAKTIKGDIVPNVPASALQLHRDVTIVLDKQAASKLF